MVIFGSQPKIEQVRVAFPARTPHDYRWHFGDGTHSPWTVAPSDRLPSAPPAAIAVEWRPHFVEKEKVDGDFVASFFRRGNRLVRSKKVVPIR